MEAFASGTGDGIAIEPTDGELVAPADGENLWLPGYGLTVPNC